METTEDSKQTVFVDTATDFEDDIEEVKRSRNNPEWLKPHQFQPGQSGNPGGRPKSTLKEYDRQRFQNMSDIEKEAFLSLIDPAMRYRMAEGNPTEDRNIKITVPTPILGGITQVPLIESEAQNGSLSTVNEEGATLLPNNVGTEPTEVVPTT